MTYEGAATELTERIEALATALHVSGVPPERAAELLAAAATAAARALAVLDEPAAPVAAGRFARSLPAAA